MTNGITRKIAGALVLAGATTAFAGETDSGRRKPSIAWAKSFDEAVQEASERNLPILVHAHASTCPPCTSLRRAVLEDADYV
jgi:thioredoxin-like negative regulator of GroEL